MKKTLSAALMCTFLLIFASLAHAEVAIGSSGNIKVSADFYGEYEGHIQNYYDLASLKDAPMYSFWVHESHFGLTGRIDHWTARFRAKYEDLRDDAGSDSDDGTAAVGAAYIDYRDGLLFRIGRTETSFGTEMFYGNQEDTGIMVGYEGEGYTVKAASYVIDETFGSREDTTLISLEADLTFGADHHVSLYDIIVSSESDDVLDDLIGATGDKTDLILHNAVLNYAGKLNDVSLKVEFNRQFGTVEYDGVSLDFTGFAAVASASIKLDTYKPSVTVGYGSGDGDASNDRIAQYVSYEADYEPDNIVIDDKPAGTNDTLSNIMFARLDVGTKIKGWDIIPGLGYYARPEEVNGSSYVGVEADLVGWYKINEMLKFKFTASYLFAGDGLGMTDAANPYKIESKFYVQF